MDPFSSFCLGRAVAGGVATFLAVSFLLLLWNLLYATLKKMVFEAHQRADVGEGKIREIEEDRQRRWPDFVIHSPRVGQSTSNPVKCALKFTLENKGTDSATQTWVGLVIFRSNEVMDLSTPAVAIGGRVGTITLPGEFELPDTLNNRSPALLAVLVTFTAESHGRTMSHTFISKWNGDLEANADVPLQPLSWAEHEYAMNKLITWREAEALRRKTL